MITRQVRQKAREQADKRRLTPSGKVIDKHHQETVERSGADAK